MRAMWWWIVVLVLVTYVWAAYYRQPPSVQMLQTTLASFQVDVLLQKQPIVVADQVADQVADLDAIRRAWFPMATAKEAVAVPGAWSRVGGKYAVIYPREDAEVLLCAPKCGMVSDDDGARIPHPDETLVAVPLKAHQLLILPFRYHFYVTSEKINVMMLNDWVSWALP